MGQVQTPAVLFSVQETAINTWTVGTDYTLPAYTLSATIDLNFAPVTNTAPSAGTVLRIRGNPYPSGSAQYWTDLIAVTTGTTAAVTTTTSAAMTANSNTSVATVGSATFGARSAPLYIKDSITAGEWIFAWKHVTTTLSFPYAVQIAHASGVSIYSQAAQYVLTVDTSGIQRIRLEVDNNTQATGPTVAVEAIISSYELSAT